MYTDPDGHDPLEMKWITKEVDKQKTKWADAQANINQLRKTRSVVDKMYKGNLSFEERLNNTAKLALYEGQQKQAHDEADNLRLQLAKVKNPKLNDDERKTLKEKTNNTSKYNEIEWSKYKLYLDSLAKKYNSYDDIALTMYVDTPNPGSREAINFKTKGPVGHSFIGIRFKDKTERFFGFYPNEEIKPINQVSKYLNGVKGKVKDSRVDEKSDQGHPYDEKYPADVTSEIGFKAFDYAYNYEVNSKMGDDKNYYYILNKNNCTTFSVNVFEAAGVKQPVKEHEWSISAGNRAQIWGKQNNISIKDAVTLAPYGYNTADAAEDIKENRVKK